MPMKPHKIVHEVPAPHVIAAVMQSNWIIEQLKRELRRALPDLTDTQLRQIIREKVLRPEVVEGQSAEEATQLIARVEQMRAAGLSMTQTVKALTAENEGDEEAYRVMMDDMHNSSGGG